MRAAPLETGLSEAWEPTSSAGGFRRPSLSDLSLGLGAMRCLRGIRAAKLNDAPPNGLTGSTRVLSRCFGELARRSGIASVGDSHAYGHQRPARFLGLAEHVARCAPKKVAGVRKNVAFRQDVPPLRTGTAPDARNFCADVLTKIAPKSTPKTRPIEN